jgi:hypothetical protein
MSMKWNPPIRDINPVLHRGAMGTYAHHIQHVVVKTTCRPITHFRQHKYGNMYKLKTIYINNVQLNLTFILLMISVMLSIELL